MSEQFSCTVHKKSVWHSSCELQMPTTLWRVLRRWLHMRLYRLQLLQSLKPADLVVCTNFCVEMQHSLEDDDNFSCFVFSQEACFHTSGKVNQHNEHTLRMTNPHAIIQHERDILKVNILCALSKQQIHGPFFKKKIRVRHYVPGYAAELSFTSAK
ncbi:hypothetical protein C0J52_04587 [Blattella germanica]|nr:hypothetical protein C0J52_04587 [Blattella germanica]